MRKQTKDQHGSNKRWLRPARLQRVPREEGSGCNEDQTRRKARWQQGLTCKKSDTAGTSVKQGRDHTAATSVDSKAINKSIEAQECSERMSASVSSNTSFNSRRSAGNSRSDGRSNCRSDRVNPHDEFHGIRFAFGRPDQVSICLQSMKKLADCAGAKMNNNMCKLVKKKVEATFPKPKAPGKDAAKHVVDEHRELMKRKLDKEDKCNEDKAKLFGIIMTQCSPEMKDKLEA